MGANEWRDAQAWPPPGAAPRGSALLQRRAGQQPVRRRPAGCRRRSPATQPPDEWMHDPDRPVPFITDPSSRADRRPGRLPRHRKPGRRAGFHQRAADRAAGDHRAGHGDRARRHLGRGHRHHGQAPGRAPRRLHPAALRRHGAAALPGRLRAEQAVAPGRGVRGEIALWDTCVRLPAGHRLRVEIASSAFPKFDVNLGTGGDMDHRDHRRHRNQPVLAHPVPALPGHPELAVRRQAAPRAR